MNSLPWSIQCAQVDGVDLSSPRVSQDQSAGLHCCQVTARFPVLGLSLTNHCQTHACDKVTKARFKICDKTLLNLNLLLNIHMLFAVAIRSRFRHFQPMFITDAPDNTLTTSVEDWCEGTMESVHSHPIGENFLSHGRLLYHMHEESSSLHALGKDSVSGTVDC